MARRSLDPAENYQSPLDAIPDELQPSGEDLLGQLPIGEAEHGDEEQDEEAHEHGEEAQEPQKFEDAVFIYLDNINNIAINIKDLLSRIVEIMENSYIVVTQEDPVQPHPFQPSHPPPPSPPRPWKRPRTSTY